MLEHIAAAIVSVSSVSADRTACPVCETGTTIESITSVTWETRVLNCEVVTSVSGSAVGVAVATESDLGVGFESCPPHEVSSSSFDAGFLGEPDADGGIVVEGFLSIDGGAGLSLPCSFSFLVDFNGTTMMPYCYMRGESSGSAFLRSFDVQSLVSFQTIGYGSYLESCTAGYASSVDIQATAALQLEIDVSVDAIGKFEPILGCEESPGNAGRGVDELPLDYAGEEQLWVVYDNAMQPVSVSRGVVAFGSDESIVRLGIFDDNAVVIGINGAGDTTVSGTVTATASTPTSGDYTFMQISRPFSSGSADFNGDGDVSPADEDLLAASLGATLSDDEYVAGVDYNLDGVISQIEVDRAQDLLESHSPSPRVRRTSTMMASSTTLTLLPLPIFTTPRILPQTSTRTVS